MNRSEGVVEFLWCSFYSASSGVYILGRARLIPLRGGGERAGDWPGTVKRGAVVRGIETSILEPKIIGF